MVRRGLSRLASEMVQAAGEAEIDLATELINQILARCNAAEWELSNIVNRDGNPSRQLHVQSQQ